LLVRFHADPAAIRFGLLPARKWNGREGESDQSGNTCKLC
jgi:hypothetical protein